MAVPRNKLSKARRNKRRAHHAKSKKNLSTCPNCSASKLSHAVCPNCGYYKGRLVGKAANDE